MKKLKVELKKISEIANQKPLVEFGGFVIRPFDNDHYWIECKNGEGMQISKKLFEEKLDDIFWELF